MAKMKLNDYRDRFDEIRDGKVLIGIHDNYMIFAFYRSFKDNKVYFYRNIFSSHWVDEDTPFMGTEWGFQQFIKNLRKFAKIHYFLI